MRPEITFSWLRTWHGALCTFEWKCCKSGEDRGLQAQESTREMSSPCSRNCWLRQPQCGVHHKPLSPSGRLRAGLTSFITLLCGPVYQILVKDGMRWCSSQIPVTKNTANCSARLRAMFPNGQSFLCSELIESAFGFHSSAGNNPEASALRIAIEAVHLANGRANGSATGKETRSLQAKAAGRLDARSEPFVRPP